MGTIELTEKVRNIKALQQLIDEATADMEALKDTVKAEMTNRKVDEMIVDVFKVRWKAVKSSRFDSGAFKSTHADLYNQYCKVTESRRFTVA